MAEHLCGDVRAAFRALQNALVSWERNTGRCSLLIFRESAGNPIEHGPMPTDVSLRLDNGISIDPANADLPDSYLLKRFTDSK